MAEGYGYVDGKGGRGFLAGLRSYLPEGRELPESEWRSRHKVILYTVWAHAVGLTIFGIYQDWAPLTVFAEGLLIALLGAIAAMPSLGRRFRSSTAALGLVTAS